MHNAVASELLEESHFLDLKREVKAGRAANKETARDLAQFAIDGGTVIIGLAESDGAVELSPERLEGLAERIELIARTNCDPPLAVISRSIPTAADPHVGYVIVHVPASPSAPHMVEGRYLGRGDKTKRYLSDAEVLRLHALRARREVDAETLLVAEFDRDPFNILRKRHQGHGFFVAEPAMPRRGMLLGLTDPPVDWNKVMTFVNQSHSPHNPAQQAIARVTTSGFRPDIGDLRTLDRRAAGVALSTYDIQQGRLISDQARIDGSAAELEIRDDGGLRIYPLVADQGLQR